MEAIGTFVNTIKDVTGPYQLWAFGIAGVVIVVLSIAYWLLGKHEPWLGKFIPLDKLAGVYQYKIARLIIVGIFIVAVLVVVFFGAINVIAAFVNYRNVYVTLSSNDEKFPVKGECSIWVYRPEKGMDPVSGIDGRLTVPNLSKSVDDRLQVGDELKCPNFVFAIPKPPDGSNRSYEIHKDNQVFIPVVYKYSKPDDPKPEDVLNEIQKAGITKEQILAKTFPEKGDRKQFTLSVDNNSGNKIDLWAYDCTFCYGNPYEDQPHISFPFSDFMRFETENLTRKQFKHFDQRPSTSGYFALYYAKRGEPQAKFLGIYNLFDKKETVFSLEPIDDSFELKPAE